MSSPAGSIIRKVPKKKGRFKDVKLAIFALAFLAFISGGAFYLMNPPPETFQLRYFTFAPVGQRDFALNVTASGVIIPREQETLRSPAAGHIQALYVQEGTDVHAGEVLVEMSSSDLTNRYNDAQRRLEQAYADLARLQFDQQMEQERLERDLTNALRNFTDATEDHALKVRLYNLGGISAKELERAELALSDAGFNLDRLERQITETQRRHQLALVQAEEKCEAEQQAVKDVQSLLAALTIRAPFSGRILELNARLSTDVANNAVLMTIADVANPIIRGHLEANTIDLVGIGQPAVITTAMSSYMANVSYIAPRAVDVGGTPVVETHWVFDRAVPELRPSTTVGIEIEVDRRLNSTFLPRGPYLTSGQQRFVYVLEGDVAVQREVRYGIITATAVEVLSGLMPNERVITSSYDEFRHLREIAVNAEGGRQQ